jgi:hypothetical protein
VGSGSRQVAATHVYLFALPVIYVRKYFRLTDRDGAILPILHDTLTSRTILVAVRAEPEGILRSSRCPVTRTFTCVPPTSNGHLVGFLRGGCLRSF